MLNQKPLKISLFPLKKKKSPQNCYNPNVKLLDPPFQMLKIKLKTEKKPTLIQSPNYKKLNLLMDPMLELKNSFNKLLIVWLLPTKKKPAQIQNLLKITQTELKMTTQSVQMQSADNQDISMMPKMPSTMMLKINQKTYQPKFINPLINNN